MASTLHKLKFRHPAPFAFIGVLTCVYLWIFSAPAMAQQASDQEVAVNLTEGRVVLCATKDAIILGAMEAQGEAGSRAPEITILSIERMGVMLGAVEWVLPDSQDKPVRLDSEFTKLVAAALNNGGKKDEAFRASDIESIGISVLERIRELAGQLHHKINLGEDEPLVRMVLAGYVKDYGPEVWVLDYHIRQDALGNDVWRTRVLRPSYNQLYPPEKGQPKTVMEVRYPPENRASGDPELLDLLQQNDSRVAKIRAANELQEKSVSLAVQGQSQKADSASIANFLKAALPAIGPPEAKLIMAKVDYDGGFHWILAPPKPPAPPPGEKPSEKTPEEPDRPTLRHKPEN
jgi:hypothetical protein